MDTETLITLQMPVLCLICHGRNSGDDTEFFMRLFDTDTDDVETKTSQILSSILGQHLTPDSVSTPLLCRPCAQLCDEYETLLKRLEIIRISLVENFSESCRDEQELMENDGNLQQQHEQSLIQLSGFAIDGDSIVLANTESLQLPVIGGIMPIAEEATTADGTDAFQLLSDPQALVNTTDDLIEMDAESASLISFSIADTMPHIDDIYAAALAPDPDPSLFAAPPASPSDTGKPIFLRDGQHFYCQMCPGDVLAIFTCATIADHLQSAHNECLFVCQLCGGDYRQSDALDEHARTEHGEYTVEDTDGIITTAPASPPPDAAATFACTSCPLLATSAAHLRQHRRQQHRVTFTCASCPRRFKSASLLQDHTNRHTNTRPFECAACAKVFVSKAALTAHQKIHAVDRARPFACTVCPKRFHSAPNLTRHVATAHSDRTPAHECPACGKHFTTAYSLQMHNVVHTGARPFQCGMCTKAFSRRPELLDHERVHTGERPFGCDECDATFAQRSNLRSHRRALHLNEKRYKCDECEKGFKRRRLLDYHVRSTHTGERPHACEQCGATFVYPEHHKKHMLIHTGERPHVCEVCGRAFSSRDNLYTHRFVHSDKKPYECLGCGQGFMRKPMLLAHMKQRKHESKKIVINRPRIFGEKEVVEEEVEGEEIDGSMALNASSAEDDAEEEEAGVEVSAMWLQGGDDGDAEFATEVIESEELEVNGGREEQQGDDVNNVYFVDKNGVALAT